MKLKPLVRGMLTFVPGADRILPRRGTGGTNSAAYCYEVWMKHLTLLWANGLRAVPATVAELGPGDSLGIGLAAMLSGAERYLALDIVRFTDTPFNLRIFDELVALFRARAGRPAKGWPDYDQHLDANLFPGHILTAERLAAALAEPRVRRLRAALAGLDAGGGDGLIRYIVPWFDDAVIEPGSVDVIVSHSTLEHVDDLELTYHALGRWLRPGGMMSHQIDLTSHNLAEEWNGYWACPEVLWRLMAGRRAFLINRQPVSVHERLIEAGGCEIVCRMRTHRADGIPRARLRPRWAALSDEDLGCSGTFIQARRPERGAQG